MSVTFTYTVKLSEVLELPAEEAVAKAVELLRNGYVLVEGSVECLAAYSQLLSFAGIVVKGREALVVLARKDPELSRILGIDEKGLEKTAVIELKHSLPAYLQQVEPSMCVAARYGSWEVPEKMVLASIEKRLRETLKMQSL
jgi:hypothetical protein